MKRNDNLVTLVKNDKEFKVRVGFSWSILLLGPFRFFYNKDYEYGMIFSLIHLLGIYLIVVEKSYLYIFLLIGLNILYSFYYPRMTISNKLTYKGFIPKTTKDLQKIKNLGLLKGF